MRTINEKKKKKGKKKSSVSHCDVTVVLFGQLVGPCGRVAWLLNKKIDERVTHP